MVGHRSNPGRQKLSGERALGQVGQFAHAKVKIAVSQFFVELNVALGGVDAGLIQARTPLRLSAWKSYPLSL